MLLKRKRVILPVNQMVTVKRTERLVRVILSNCGDSSFLTFAEAAVFHFSCVVYPAVWKKASPYLHKVTLRWHPQTSHRHWVSENNFFFFQMNYQFRKSNDLFKNTLKCNSCKQCILSTVIMFIVSVLKCFLRFFGVHKAKNMKYLSLYDN